MSAIQTRCPRCGTLFRASDEQLDAAGGLVRCGACEEVFDARQHSVAPFERSGGDTPPPGALNEDYIGDMLQQPAPLPARTPLVELPVELHAPRRSRDRRLALGFGSVLLALALGAQYAWFSRERYAQEPGLRPWYVQACAWLGCTLPAYRDPASIRSDGLLIRPDPARAGVLLVDAVLTNRAPFAQRYPDLELSFTDLHGKPVARRVFAPREYLGAIADAEALMPPREPVRVHLELKDPGEHATNYELRLIDNGVQQRSES